MSMYKPAERQGDERERKILKALHHEQPDKTPWDLGFTDTR
jgi:hypothetical protein